VCGGKNDKHTLVSFQMKLAECGRSQA